MSENDRDDRGHFRSEHDDGEYVDVVAERQPAGTAEVADALGVTRQNADKRLRRLEDDGRIASKKIGSSLAWTIDDGRSTVTNVDADDEFWDADTYDGEAMSAEDIDDVLYG